MIFLMPGKTFQMKTYIQKIFDLEDVAIQSLTVRSRQRKKLRVFKGNEERLKIAQNRIEKWEVPGN